MKLELDAQLNWRWSSRPHREENVWLIVDTGIAAGAPVSGELAL